MSLDERSYSNQGTTGVRPHTCPLLVNEGPERCDYEFTDRESRYKHYLLEHTPEDAGLFPILTAPEADAQADGPQRSRGRHVGWRRLKNTLQPTDGHDVPQALAQHIEQIDADDLLQFSDDRRTWTVTDVVTETFDDTDPRDTQYAVRLRNDPVRETAQVVGLVLNR